MRRIILLIVILLAVLYIVVSFTQLESIIETLRKGNLPFLLAAFLFELICLFNNSVTFGALFRLVGMKEDRWHLFLMTTASTFISMITPTGGMGGMAVFIDSARQRKLSTGRVLVVGILYLLYEYASLLCVVMVGFIVLIRRNNLNTGELTAASIMFLIALGDVVVLYLGYKSKDRLGRLLAGLSRLVNRLLKHFIHRDLINVKNAYKLSSEISEGISTLRGNPRKLIWPFLFSLNNKAILISVLAFTFLALDTPYSTGTLIGGFSIGHLFYYISPTPGGVGVVEGIFPLALNSLRVPFAKAVLITLTYRSITLWFPLLVGFVSFRILQKKHGV